MKMTKKKRWFSKIYPDSQENKLLDINISWSNSDSDEDLFPQSKKLCEKRPKSWISVIPQSTTPSKGNRKKLNITSPPKVSSPVLSGVPQTPQIEDASPILHSTPQSPVLISRKQIIRKIKWKDTQWESPTGIIVESQTQHDPLTQVVISPAESEASQNWNIDPFPSQHSSEIIDSNSDVRLYHEPPPRRKRFKKGGLAWRLHKAVEKRDSSVAIWQHELFLNRAEMVQACGQQIVDFIVRSRWQEYGCVVLECGVAGETKVFGSFSDLSNFLIVVNKDVSLCFEVDSSYKLFPPYSTKVVEYAQKNTVVFVNTSRFVAGV